MLRKTHDEILEIAIVIRFILIFLNIHFLKINLIF